MEGPLMLLLAILFLPVIPSRGQDTDDSSGDGSGGDSGLPTPLIIVLALIGGFAIVIIILSVAIVIMCRRRTVRRVDFKPKASNTYRGFSQERTQSPSESTVIHDPLSHPPSSRSTRSQSHSHPPTSPSSLHPSVVSHAPLPLPSTGHPRSVSEPGRHNYHHLRQHEGMMLLPADYPEHEYSHLGPRSEIPPLRPPKPPQLQNTNPGRPPSDTTAKEPPVSSTAPPWSTENLPPEEGTETNHTNQNFQDSPLCSAPESENIAVDPRDDSDVFLRRSIYDTMEDSSQAQLTAGRSTEHKTTDNGHSYYVLERPSKSDGGRENYDMLAMQSSLSPTRQQQKSSVKIFDDPEYSPFDANAKRTRSDSVKVVDPRYVGDYERHPDYVPPNVDIPKGQLDKKYHGDYERDPTYFSKLPVRSFSTSAQHSTNPEQQRRPSLNLDPRLDKYRGNYERSEDYLPPPLQNGNLETRTEDYVLEPDPNYTGAYERHPDYVPPLVRRPSKSKVQIISKEGGSTSPGSSTFFSSAPPGGRPSHVPHEYTALADAMKDPPQQYATLNSDLHTTCSLPSPKDSTV